MVALVWIALAVFVVAVVAGGVLATMRGLAAWRALNRFRRGLTESTAGMADRLEATERRLARASETAMRLDRARASLESSIATLQALADAGGEFKELIDRARAFGRP